MKQQKAEQKLVQYVSWVVMAVNYSTYCNTDKQKQMIDAGINTW